MKFDVMNRWSGKLQFSAEIECDENALPCLKMGLAVKWALKSDAVLSDAVLSDAVLSGADLSGAAASAAAYADAILAALDGGR